MSDPLDIARPAPAEEPFIITAMLSLVGASVWLVRRPDLLTQYYYSPEHLALTHLVTLGFITPFIMGVSLRLVPMTLGVGVVSRKLAWLQFALYGIGASGMVTHFLWSQWLAVGWSGLLVLAATIVQLINFTPVWRRARAGDWIARYFVAAQTHLVLVATVGVILGMQNAGYRWTTGLFPGTMPERLSAHFHLAAVGWVSSMIFGFQLKLYRRRPVRHASSGFASRCFSSAFSVSPRLSSTVRAGRRCSRS